jgi:diguanylate cyclase (GGDEF)-like protein/PAS domain S-box-containing protein
MKPIKFKSLQRKIIVSVLSVTFILAILASVLSFFIEFDRSKSKTADMIMQLIDTVENTAAIAAYAKDKEIAQDVVTGLLKNDIVNRVQINSLDGFNLIQAKNADSIEKGTIRVLYSPFGETRIIGYLHIQPPAQYNLKEAIHSTIFNITTSVIFIIVTGLIILWVIQINFSLPATFISNTLRSIKDGEARRIPELTKNNNDELGRLVVDINELLFFLESNLNNERFLRERIETVERQLRHIFNSSSAGLFLLDEDGNLLTSNITLKTILNIPNISDNLLTDKHLLASFFNEQEEFTTLLKKTLKSGQLESQDFSLAQTNTGSIVWLHCLVSKVINSDGKIGIEGVLFNITERVENELATKHEANHDPLTGLLRRQAAETLFENYLVSCKEPNVSIFLMDLDGFKQVNDQYGHLAGDKVLMIAAQRLIACVRSSDIVSRLGGDEFLIILINCGFEQSKENIAENIIKSIQKPIQIDAQTTANVGISLGIADLTKNNQNFETLTQLADTAMYEVKRQGKNGYCFYDKNKMTVKLFHS